MQTIESYDFDKVFMTIKDTIPTLIHCNPVIVNGLECVNSKGGVALIQDNEQFKVELDYDFDYQFTGDITDCVYEFRRLAAQ